MPFGPTVRARYSAADECHSASPLARMIELELRDSAVARSLRASDARAVHALMTESRSHLDQWLRWSAAIHSLDERRSPRQSVRAEGSGWRRVPPRGLGWGRVGRRSGLLVHPQGEPQCRSRLLARFSLQRTGARDPKRSGGRGASVRGGATSSYRDAMRSRECGKPSGSRTMRPYRGGYPAGVSLDHRPIRRPCGIRHPCPRVGCKSVG